MLANGLVDTGGFRISGVALVFAHIAHGPIHGIVGGITDKLSVAVPYHDLGATPPVSAARITAIPHIYFTRQARRVAHVNVIKQESSRILEVWATVGPGLDGHIVHKSVGPGRARPRDKVVPSISRKTALHQNGMRVVQGEGIPSTARATSPRVQLGRVLDGNLARVFPNRDGGETKVAGTVKNKRKKVKIER